MILKVQQCYNTHMKLVVQRVKSASVEVVGTKKVVGKIGKGFFVLVGVGKNDTEKKAHQLAGKLAKLRVMSDEFGKMNLSVRDVGAEVLVVSQFTLYAYAKDGNRPSFIEAADPKKAREIYEHFIDELKNLGVEVETGSFGEYMKINMELDGPVTIILES